MKYPENAVLFDYHGDIFEFYDYGKVGLSGVEGIYVSWVYKTPDIKHIWIPYNCLKPLTKAARAVIKELALEAGLESAKRDPIVTMIGPRVL